MADGYDCTCAAHSENECCCGADWTPQETYDLRDQLAASKQREAELVAHVERLRGTMNDLLMIPDKYPGHRNLMTIEIITKALAATPAQSLARLRNEVLEKAEKVCEQATTIGACIAAIRELKEPECSSHDPN